MSLLLLFGGVPASQAGYRSVAAFWMGGAGAVVASTGSPHHYYAQMRA